MLKGAPCNADLLRMRDPTRRLPMPLGRESFRPLIAPRPLSEKSMNSEQKSARAFHPTHMASAYTSTKSSEIVPTLNAFIRSTLLKSEVRDRNAAILCFVISTSPSSLRPDWIIR